MKILALIPARSGSKGLRHKNIQKVGGQTLLARAVGLAQASQRRGEQWQILVSSDSDHYLRLARRAGAETLRRPKRLAGPRSRLADVVQHALEHADPCDAVVMLACTTPLTLPKDVRGALVQFRRGKTSVISVTKDRVADNHRLRLQNGRLSLHQGQQTIGPRQASPTLYRLNGAIYVATPVWLRKHGQFLVPGRSSAFLMPHERSLDIEDQHDLAVAEHLAGAKTR